MNKKTRLSFLFCLVLCASLFAFQAFAEDTVIVIGGAVGNSQADNIGAQSALNSVSAINSSAVVIVSDNRNALAPAASSANAGITEPVIVMPNGQVEQISSQSNRQTQTTAPTIIASVEASNGLAKSILALLNEIRIADGLSALSYSADLQAAADTRARESAENFSHQRPNGSGCETAVTVDYYVTGENLIQVTNELATATIMVDTWMNSPSHRANILLSSFTDVAVGIYVANGTTYVSTVFVGY